MPRPPKAVTPSPVFDIPAIARCRRLWDPIYEPAVARGRHRILAARDAAPYYRDAMPPLTSLQNIRDFIACTAHGVLIGAIEPIEASRLLYAAQTAFTVLRFMSQPQPIDQPQPSETPTLPASTQPQTTPPPPPAPKNPPITLQESTTCSHLIPPAPAPKPLIIETLHAQVCRENHPKCTLEPSARPAPAAAQPSPSSTAAKAIPPSAASLPSSPKNQPPHSLPHETPQKCQITPTVSTGYRQIPRCGAARKPLITITLANISRPHFSPPAQNSSASLPAGCPGGLPAPGGSETRRLLPALNSVSLRPM